MTNNIFFVYLLGILVIVNYDAFEKRQKIAIIYACSYGLMLNHDLRCIVIIFLLLFTLFLYEEYLGEDLVKIRYVTSIKYKFLDFVYMYIIQYKILYIILAISLKSNKCGLFFEKFVWKSAVLSKAMGSVLLAISIILLMLGIHKLFDNSVELKNFEQINQKFSEYPYYFLPLRNQERCQILFEKLELVADIEDHTFFKRKRSYSSFSLEFIEMALKKRKENKTNIERKERDWFDKILHRAIRIFKVERFFGFLRSKHKIKCLKKLLRQFFRLIYMAFIQKIRSIKKKVRRYLRGYSTIEMQLIRILSYKKGLKMGRPRNLEEVYLIFTRKIYEVIYAPMFMTGHKRYLMISKEKDFYRYYLVYIYLHTVQTNLNGKVFAPLDKIFGDVDVIDWPKEALFVVVLGLNGLRITRSRVDAYEQIVKKYSLNKELIYQLVDCI